MAAGKERAQREASRAASAPQCRATCALSGPTGKGQGRTSNPRAFLSPRRKRGERAGWGVKQEGKPTCQGQRGTVRMPSHPGHALLRPVSGMPRPIGWAASVRPRPQDHPAGAGSSGAEQHGHAWTQKSSVQPAESRLARGITLQELGRGRRAGGVRVGGILACGGEGC